MSEIDRDAFLESLERLLSENDEEVLASAREIKARLTDAGVSWDMLLVQAPSDDDDGYYAEDDEDEDDAIVEGATSEFERAAPAPDDDLALIDDLLTNYELTSETREELEEYKGDIAEGEFTESDHRYLKSLYQRVAGKKKKG